MSGWRPVLAAGVVQPDQVHQQSGSVAGYWMPVIRPFAVPVGVSVPGICMNPKWKEKGECSSYDCECGKNKSWSMGNREICMSHTFAGTANRICRSPLGASLETFALIVALMVANRA